jgi:HEAT repeat protein
MSDSTEFQFQTLVDALLDPDNPVDPRYLHHLSDLEDDDLSLFREVWSQVSLSRRQTLLEDLNDLGAADDLLSFENVGRLTIGDPDAQVRTLAAQLLWEFEERDLMLLFIELLDSDPVPEVRAAAATGLGLFVYHGEIDRLPKQYMGNIESALLLAAEKDQSELVQCRALESVGYSSRAEVVTLIDAAFTSGDHDKMASALIAMGRSMDPHWQKAILQMLNGKIPALRAEAARAAGEIEIKDSVPDLVELCGDSEQNVRHAAIWSLSEIGGDQARHTLEQLFREADDDQEADFIQSALDNVAFTDGMQPISLFDVPEESPEDDLLEMLISQDSSPESNGNGDLHSDLSGEDWDTQAGDDNLSEDEDLQG